MIENRWSFLRFLVFFKSMKRAQLADERFKYWGCKNVIAILNKTEFLLMLCYSNTDPWCKRANSLYLTARKSKEDVLSSSRIMIPKEKRSDYKQDWLSAASGDRYLGVPLTDKKLFKFKVLKGEEKLRSHSLIVGRS